MALLPHDTTDLALAPLLLHLEHEIGTWSGLTDDEVEHRIALEANRQPKDVFGRREAVIRSLTRFVDLHGWDVTLNDRGLRLNHRHHAVTIGLPASLRRYLDV